MQISTVINILRRPLWSRCRRLTAALACGVLAGVLSPTDGVAAKPGSKKLRVSSTSAIQRPTLPGLATPEFGARGGIAPGWALVTVPRDRTYPVTHLQLDLRVDADAFQSAEGLAIRLRNSEIRQKHPSQLAAPGASPGGASQPTLSGKMLFDTVHPIDPISEAVVQVAKPNGDKYVITRLNNGDGTVTIRVAIDVESDHHPENHPRECKNNLGGIGAGLIQREYWSARLTRVDADGKTVGLPLQAARLENWDAKGEHYSEYCQFSVIDNYKHRCLPSGDIATVAAGAGVSTEVGCPPSEQVQSPSKKLKLK